MDTEIFVEIESNVRSYCRTFPAVFQRAKGAKIYDEQGNEYIDFFAGAGALNFGHNNDYIKQRIIKYIEGDGLVHALDMYTGAKREFLTTFKNLILEPKGLDYKVQFCGPTGTNAIEAALKLARKAKHRPGIFSFMGGYHGMSLGSLAATGERASRAAAGVPLNGITFVPFPGGFMSEGDTIDYLEAILRDPLSGIEPPAAVLVETVQAEGGVLVAPSSWLRHLRDFCDEHDILLICDEIQVGCYRTGPFFSFERSGIVPDMVTLSKSISGYGLPMSLLLMRRDIDVWSPGEHTGTFRGNQLAFVGATAALELAHSTQLPQEVLAKARTIEEALLTAVVGISSASDRIEVRGLGMIWGVDLSRLGQATAQQVVAHCFELGLIVERVGRHGSVIKVIPPLTIDLETLRRGLSIIERAIEDTLANS